MNSARGQRTIEAETPNGNDIDNAVAAHDAAIAARGLDIWVGNEPTFTDRFSQAAEWLTGAAGEDKRQRTEGLIAALARDRPGDAILRCIGRQYPGENEPRCSIGLYGRRDGRSVWSGPPDPAVASPHSPADLNAFDVCVADALLNWGFSTRRFTGRGGDFRHVVERGNPRPIPDLMDDPRLQRPSIHGGPISPAGLCDELARDGLYLLLLGRYWFAGKTVPSVELPAVADVETFVALLGALGEAAARCDLPNLVLLGFPPPVDATVRWTTVTPDPAVVEVNSAPHATVAAFLEDTRRHYSAASALKLSPYRLYYNGDVADSGGGGQITFGGASPARSPFFLSPQLLPRLVRYVARHPSLSYLFAHDHVGPFGQSVRPDEMGADVLTELRLALRLLAREESPSPTVIWQSLAPFLADASGNSHRAEINIEKLWNPNQPNRGMLGLVEFRAFRMQHSPERAAALATLMRSILAHLIVDGDAIDRLDLPEWGSQLHDRFSLPFYLEADLREVLTDLRASGFGLGAALTGELQTDPWRTLASFTWGHCSVTIRRAVDFWFLLGDASNQAGTSRLVDASTGRIEIVLRPRSSGASGKAIAGWKVRANDIELPLRHETDPDGPVRVCGVRYRRFVPSPGLHPTLGPQSPLRLLFIDPAKTGAYEVRTYDWSPDGANYKGVPSDLGEATTRRANRCVLRHIGPEEVPIARPMPPGAHAGFTLDIRYPSIPCATGTGTIHPSDQSQLRRPELHQA